MNDLKILVINSCVYPYPPRAYSGLEYISGLRAEELARLGYEVYFASPKGSRVKHAKLIETVEASWDINKEKEAFEIYKEIIKDVDVIIDDSWLKLSFTDAYYKDKLYLLVCHNPFAYQHLEKTAVFPPNAIFIAPSKALADYLSWRFNARIEVAEHGIDFEFYKPTTDKKEDFYLFVGRIEKMKGAHNFIRLCRDLGIKGYVVGRYDNVPDYDYVNQVLKSCRNGIEFLGEVERKELVDLYSKAKATILLHDYIFWLEAFGLVAVESLACKTPVFATKSGAFEEIIINGLTGILSNNYYEIKKMVELYEKGEIRFDLDLCRKSVEKYKKEEMAKRYEKIIYEIRRKEKMN